MTEPLTLRPMSECQPVCDQEALLYIRGYGYIVGRFFTQEEGRRRYYAHWSLPDHWSVPDNQGGDCIPVNDPSILGWYPLGPEPTEPL